MGQGIEIDIVEFLKIVFCKAGEERVKEIVELLVGVEVFWNEHCSLICIKSREDRDFMPLCCTPRIYRSNGNHATFAIDYRLKGPPNGGVVFVEDVVGGGFNFLHRIGLERADDLFGGDVFQAKIFEEFRKLVFVERVRMGVTGASGGGAGLDDYFVEEGVRGVVAE